MTVAVELIPGEHYLVLIDADETELPDRVAREELASLTMSQRDKPTLGLDSFLQAPPVVDDVIATLVATAVTARYSAAKQWLKRYRGMRTPSPLTESDEERAARGALGSASELASVSLRDDGASVTLRNVGPRQWVVDARSESLEVMVLLMPDAGMAEVIFRETDD